jgi:hypothetical protein
MQHLQPAVPERAKTDVNLPKAAGASYFLAEGATCEEVILTKAAGEEGTRVFLFVIQAPAIFLG